MSKRGGSECRKFGDSGTSFRRIGTSGDYHEGGDAGDFIGAGGGAFRGGDGGDT